MGNYHCIVQARMESERLPGKIWKPMNGQPMLLWQLERLSRCQNIDNIVVATHNSQANADLYENLSKHGYSSYIHMGLNENDVLDRYWKCLDWIMEEIGSMAGIHNVVRITGDCPLIDPLVVDEAILYFEEQGVDYVALSEHWPDGLDVEVMSVFALSEAVDKAKEDYEREHVTPWIYLSSQLKQASYPCPFDLSGYNWSVDDMEDFYFIETIQAKTIKEAGFDFDWRDVYTILLRNKSWIDTAKRKPRNESFMKQVGIDAPWEDLRYSQESGGFFR